VCVGCGENDYHVLTVDHIDGRLPDEAYKTRNLYLDILKDRIDVSRLRVLCGNCQIRNEYRRGNRVIYPEIADEVVKAGGTFKTIAL